MANLPGIGDPLPDIAMATSDGGTVRPADFAGRKLVLFFYPKDDTPGCTTENQDFSALAEAFAAADTALLGVSKDPPARHQKFIAKYALTVPLASDAAEGGLSDGLGFWAEKLNYGRSYMGMVRSTVLVGADGRIARGWPRSRLRATPPKCSLPLKRCSRGLTGPGVAAAIRAALLTASPHERSAG